MGRGRRMMSDYNKIESMISEHENVLIQLLEAYAILLEEKFYQLGKCEDEICYKAGNALLDTIANASGRCGYIELNQLIMSLIRQRVKDKELYSLFQE